MTQDKFTPPKQPYEHPSKKNILNLTEVEKLCEKPTCPTCGVILTKQEGCLFCHNCHYERC